MMVTIVGVSGSGKSSIVYDILYKKSVDQYLRYRDLVSDTLEIQICDEIIGLSPVIAVRQNTIRQANPKSVIGTKFKITDDLKKLYLLEGTIICPHCGVRLLISKYVRIVKRFCQWSAKDSSRFILLRVMSLP